MKIGCLPILFHECFFIGNTADCKNAKKILSMNFEWLKLQIMLFKLFQPKKVQISGKTGKGVGGMISSHPNMIVMPKNSAL